MIVGSSEYVRVHRWIRKTYGKADHCEFDPSHVNAWYDWSNKDNNYARDLENWQQLCRSCHKFYDAKLSPKTLKKSCKNGHEFTEENIIWRKTSKYVWRACRKCQYEFYKKYYKRVLAAPSKAKGAEK